MARCSGFLAVPLMMALMAPAQAATFYDGLKAYNSGDFSRAERIWRPLAERDNGNAQSGLGLLYYKGLGIEPDVGEAMRWFGLAANNGVVQAQMFLSIMLWRGYGVKPSPVWAYVWSDLAVTAGLEEAVQLRDQIEFAMSETEVARARDLIAQWHDSRARRR